MYDFAAQLMTCGEVRRTTQPGVFRLCRRVIHEYDEESIVTFERDIVAQAKTHDVDVEIINSGGFFDPTIPYRDSRRIENTSHYWVEVSFFPKVDKGQVAS